MLNQDMYDDEDLIRNEDDHYDDFNITKSVFNANFLRDLSRQNVEVSGYI